MFLFVCYQSERERERERQTDSQTDRQSNFLNGCSCVLPNTNRVIVVIANAIAVPRHIWMLEESFLFLNLYSSFILSAGEIFFFNLYYLQPYMYNMESLKYTKRSYTIFHICIMR